MGIPDMFSKPSIINARLVTKTSLPKPKSTLALAILLWISCGKPASVEYGEPKDGQLVLDRSLMDLLLSDIKSALSKPIETTHLADRIKGNLLLSSQIEALNAAFELIWHIARFSFADSSLTLGAERTGGKRYRKLVRFTNNMDIIAALIESDKGAYYDVLLSWLSENDHGCDTAADGRLARVITSLSERSFYKTGKGEEGAIYVPNGIYRKLVIGERTVQLTDGEEAQGPTRILKAVIKEGLNPYLQAESPNNVVRADDTSKTLEDYLKRVETGFELSRIEVIAPIEQKSLAIDNDIECPRNLIYFGAPGTGKSYQLNEEALGGNGIPAKFASSNVNRITFHPDYTYAQFVGCYKPYTVEVANGRARTGYRFTPGPFLETYAIAKLHPEQNYLLIIEELNRANPAAVFGDIFQLLDRTETGASRYEVDVPKEMQQCLEDYLLDLSFEEKQNLSDDYTKQYKTKLALPSNMYIWATTNSADQGVFPMDTAFKRRWDFCYIGIDEKESQIPTNQIFLGKDKHETTWNDLRKGINKVLLDSRVNEDKLLGPFFIDPKTIGNPDAFLEVFKNKVLLYLYEDAAKTKREKVFSSGSVTYATICLDFDNLGEGVFNNFPSVNRQDLNSGGDVSQIDSEV